MSTDNALSRMGDNVSANDPLWDEFVRLWFPSRLCKTDKTRIGRLVRMGNEKGIEPKDLSIRKLAHERDWPKLGEPTPESVLKHWDRLRPKRKRRTEHETPEVEIERGQDEKGRWWAKNKPKR